jgi:hypothetical protein
VFEKTALMKLAEEGQLMSYVHTGFWQCMDNKREMDMLVGSKVFPIPTFIHERIVSKFPKGRVFSTYIFFSL